MSPYQCIHFLEFSGADLANTLEQWFDQEAEDLMIIKSDFVRGKSEYGEITYEYIIIYSYATLQKP